MNTSWDLCKGGSIPVVTFPEFQDSVSNQVTKLGQTHFLCIFSVSRDIKGWSTCPCSAETGRSFVASLVGLAAAVGGVAEGVEEEWDVVVLGGVLDLEDHLRVRVERLGLLVPGVGQGEMEKQMPTLGLNNDMV